MAGHENFCEERSLILTKIICNIESPADITDATDIRMKADILTRADVRTLVDRFYQKVQADALLGPVFSHVHWPHHLPIMYNFWSSMILGDDSYRGNPLQKHLPLPIQPEHFNQWLKLFRETLKENFDGEKADEAMMRAETIAQVFQMRMGLTRK